MTDGSGVALVVDFDELAGVFVTVASSSPVVPHPARARATTARAARVLRLAFS